MERYIPLFEQVLANKYSFRFGGRQVSTIDEKLSLLDFLKKNIDILETYYSMGSDIFGEYSNYNSWEEYYEGDDKEELSKKYLDKIEKEAKKAVKNPKALKKFLIDMGVYAYRDSNRIGFSNVPQDTFAYNKKIDWKNVNF